jgi:hypothetical protein
MATSKKVTAEAAPTERRFPWAPRDIPDPQAGDPAVPVWDGTGYVPGMVPPGDGDGGGGELPLPVTPTLTSLTPSAVVLDSGAGAPIVVLAGTGFVQDTFGAYVLGNAGALSLVTYVQGTPTDTEMQVQISLSNAPGDYEITVLISDMVDGTRTATSNPLTLTITIP